MAITGKEGQGTFPTQVPAATAFSVLYQRVLNYVQAPSDTTLTTIAKQEINDAISRLNQREWWWTRGVSPDIPLVAGTKEYILKFSPVAAPVASDFRSPRILERLNTTGEPIGSLPFMPMKTFSQTFQDRSNLAGTPSAYTIFNDIEQNVLTLNYGPSAAYIATTKNLRMRYFRRLAYFSADADTVSTLFAPTDVEAFIVWYARAGLAAIFRPEAVAYAERRWQELWDFLVKASQKHDTTDW